MSLLGSRAQGPERSAVSCYFSRLDVMATDELEVIRALLTSKPRPEGWSERRERLDELGSVPRCLSRPGHSFLADDRC